VNYIIPIGKKFHPFLNLKTGYGISSKKFYYDDESYKPIPGNVNVHNTGGFFISPAVGVACPINNKNNLQLSIGYDYQKLNSHSLLTPDLHN
jgi:hypothetical protein